MGYCTEMVTLKASLRGNEIEAEVARHLGAAETPKSQ